MAMRSMRIAIVLLALLTATANGSVVNESQSDERSTWSLAFGSCMHQNKPIPAIDLILAKSPDAVRERARLPVNSR
jgi:hypothetical protein